MTRSRAIAEREGGPLALVAQVTEEEHEGQLHEPEEDRERRERPERMDVVGAASWTARRKAAPDAEAFEHEHRHDEADEREPGDSRKNEEERQEGRGRKHDRADDDRARQRRALGRTPPTIATAPVKDAAMSGEHAARTTAWKSVEWPAVI